MLMHVVGELLRVALFQTPLRRLWQSCKPPIQRKHNDEPTSTLGCYVFGPRDPGGDTNVFLAPWGSTGLPGAPQGSLV